MIRSSNSRRTFAAAILPALLFALALSISACAFADGVTVPAPDHYRSLSIYHANDVHSYLAQSKDSATKKMYGGAARLATLFKAAPAGESIFLMAGDLVQGTLYYNFFHGGADIEVYNAIGLDALCLGNHEFDGGVASLHEYYSKAGFPVLASNVSFQTSPELAKMVKPYVIVERNSLKIAVIGVETPQTISNDPKLGADIGVSDPVAAVREYAVELRKKADLIVALTHIGHQEDLRLAADVPELDIVIGGHSHTEVPVPVAVSRKDGVCMVGQTGAYLKYMGKMKLKVCPASQLAPGAPRYVYESGGLTYLGEEVTPDPTIDAIVNRYGDQIGASVKVPFASTANELNGDMTANRTGETNLGNLFADALKELMKADLAIVNGGNFRASITGPRITYENIYTTAPYDNPVVAVSVTGAELLEDIKMTAARYDGSWGGFLHFSKGVMVVYENHALVSASLDGVAIDPARTYRVAMSEYIAGGGDGHSVYAGKKTDQGAMIKVSDAVIGYIKSQPQPLNYRAEGRIVTNAALTGILRMLFMKGR